MTLQTWLKNATHFLSFVTFVLSTHAISVLLPRPMSNNQIISHNRNKMQNDRAQLWIVFAFV